MKNSTTTDSKPEIRPLKADDLVTMFQMVPWTTIRGFTAELDGKVIGVAGVAYMDPMQCFSHIDPVMKQYPRQIVEAVRKVRGLLDSLGVRVYATPAEYEETADSFLRHVGFEQIEDGVYAYG